MISSTRREKNRPTCRATYISVLVAGLLASTAVVAQSNTTPTDVQDLHITVEPGDTFSDIVTRELNSYDAWGEIARYNKLDSPDNLKPGDVIIIPAQVLRLRNYATVIFTKGNVTHHSSVTGKKGKLTKGDKMYPGDLIETAEDGFVNLTFNGGSTVNIQPDSSMKINALDCIDRENECQIKLRTEKGQLGLDVQRNGFAKPTVFSIDSPYASAAVRGTRFDFDIDDGNVLGVTEGSVAISLNGNSNDVRAGKGVVSGGGKSLNDLIDLLENPTFNLNDDITRISSEDVISWDAVNGAVSYLLAFDKDESMQSVLTNFVETKLYTKPALPTGDYFIRGRAVDSNGLRGFASKKQIRAVTINDQIEPTEIDVQIDGTDMKITASGSATDDIEVKIGNAVVTIDGVEYIMGENTLRLKGGETTTVDVDPAMPWYLQSRNIVNRNNVSPYGLLYFFDKIGG